MKSNYKKNNKKMNWKARGNTDNGTVKETAQKFA
jgi:hypothetical protein